MRSLVDAAMLVFVLVFAHATTASARDSDFEINDETVQLTPARVPVHPSVVAMEALGRTLFFDRNLSRSRQQSCSSCHDPAHAYGPPNAHPAQPGGVTLREQGQRAAPSLRYLQKVPVFTEHYFDEDVDESIDNGPTGGLTWDGRVLNPREQARIPLLSPLEMANASEESVVKAVAASDYAPAFRQAFGPHVFDESATAFAAITRSLEVFQQNPAEFYPYSSKYDAYLRHQVALSAQEERGLALFNDPGKGNCAHCHPSSVGSSGALPSFTDFGYVSLGVPRNPELRGNRDPAFYDLGLCGPFRTDLRGRDEYCGLFRTPSLRNVALRRAFFHNGVLHTLRKVVEFYVERESHPEKWYSRDARGGVRRYDDLPEKYRENLNKEAPFDRDPAGPPPLDASGIADIVAFLGTLTDGWQTSAHIDSATRMPPMPAQHE
ncbi:MAG: cytochrome c peroxidase [Gammaproteobacteria bacterium]